MFAALMICAVASRADAQTDSSPPPPPPAGNTSRTPGDTSFIVETVARAELWRFFEPRPGGGVEPDYAFVGARSTLGAAYDGPRWAMQGAIQYVRLENLPRGAIGPGLLGTGAAYFFQAAGTFSYQFYLRTLSLRVNDLRPGVSAEAGRLSMVPRPPSTNVDVAALDQSRVSGRLLGDMEWSLYQRAWDGVRVTVQRDRWVASAIGAKPTQGTFEESANLTLDRVRVLETEVVSTAGLIVPHTTVRAFGMMYDDTRDVHARPDNSGIAANAADVHIATLGASAVGVYPHGPGRWDAVLWTAAQAGEWYGAPHRALSVAGEAGYQWSSFPGRPWLRAGGVYASGDADGTDSRHHTFFQMLPSGDQFVRSTTYALMNVLDTWAEGRVSSPVRIDVSVGLHHVTLVSGGDRWYSGSGATERRGNYFGFLGRNTRGARHLGTVVESTVTWRPARRWTLRGYAGRMAGGDAVRNVFAGRRLLSGWLESTLSF